MHLPGEAILGGPVCMRWMYSFEVPDEEGVDFISDEGDVVHQDLEDDNQDDDAVDPPSQPDYQLSSCLAKTKMKAIQIAIAAKPFRPRQIETSWLKSFKAQIVRI